MLNYAAHDVNLFSTDRETVRETRREIRALFETLVNAFRETREDGPAATVAALISRIGYEAARVAIAETIAASSTHDGRIEDRRRAWAATVPGCPAHEALAAANIYAPDEIHPAHRDQLAAVMMRTPEPEAATSHETAPEAVETAPEVESIPAVTPAVYPDKSGRAHRVAGLWDPTRSRCSFSNEKTGIPSWSLLAGDRGEDYSGKIPAFLREALPVCSGTCSGTCPGCYALNMTRCPDVYIKLALNTIEALADPARFLALVEAELFRDPLTDPRVVRCHDSGDMASAEYLAEFYALARRHPGTVFGTYTKEEDTVNGAGLDAIPGNVVMQCSPWPGHCNPIGDLPQFVYDDGSDPDVATLPHCPAVDKDGHRTGIQCRNCLHCYKARRGDRWAVYAH